MLAIFTPTQYVNYFYRNLHKVQNVADFQIFKPPRNKIGSLENMVILYIQRTRPGCRNEKFYATETRERLIISMQMGFVDIATQCLKQWFVFLNAVFFQEARPDLSEEDFQQRKREMDEMRKLHMEEKG